MLLKSVLNYGEKAVNCDELNKELVDLGYQSADTTCDYLNQTSILVAIDYDTYSCCFNKSNTEQLLSCI